MTKLYDSEGNWIGVEEVREMTREDFNGLTTDFLRQRDIGLRHAMAILNTMDSDQRRQWLDAKWEPEA